MPILHFYGITATIRRKYIARHNSLMRFSKGFTWHSLCFDIRPADEDAKKSRENPFRWVIGDGWS